MSEGAAVWLSCGFVCRLFSVELCLHIHVCVLRVCRCVKVCVRTNEVLWWFHTPHAQSAAVSLLQCISAWSSLEMCVCVCVCVCWRVCWEMWCSPVSVSPRTATYTHTHMPFVSLGPAFSLTPQETMAPLETNTFNWAFSTNSFSCRNFLVNWMIQRSKFKVIVLCTSCVMR